MKKHELKEALSRIQPREELIQSTIEQVNAYRQKARQQKTAPAFRLPTPVFATRLAGALCALLLVVGMGVMVGRNRTYIPTSGEGAPAAAYRAAEETRDSQTEEETLTLHETSISLMEKAQADGGTWVVAEGDLQACYFIPLTDEQKSRGVLYCCGAEIYVLSAAASEEGLEGAPVEQERFGIVVEFFEEDAVNHLINATGSVLGFRLSARQTEGEPAWVLEEFITVE